jgi:glutamine amidotransferase
MKVAILDTGGANHRSIKNALAELGVDAPVVRDHPGLTCADKWILPGVGHGGHVMQKIRDDGLVETIRTSEKLILGICVGMQIFHEFLAEGATAGLGLLPGEVTGLDARGEFRVPHMGWNRVWQCKPSRLLSGVEDGSYFYFTHSYVCPNTTASVAEVRDRQQFVAAFECKNFFGTQFHPEKSGKNGKFVLKNFLDL